MFDILVINIFYLKPSKPSKHSCAVVQPSWILLLDCGGKLRRPQRLLLRSENTKTSIMDSETFRQCMNCKKYSHDVDIHQNDEVQCNQSYSTSQTSSRPTPSWPHLQGEVGAAHQPDDSDLGATSVLYESLLDNLNIKQKAK